MARVEARVSVVEGKLDQLLERVGHVPTKALAIGTTSAATIRLQADTSLASTTTFAIEYTCHVVTTQSTMEPTIP